jgi:hypothetical protein
MAALAVSQSRNMREWGSADELSPVESAFQLFNTRRFWGHHSRPNTD